MGTAYIPDDVWQHRAVKRLDNAQKYVVARLLGMADQWGRLRLEVEALADAADVDDGEAKDVLDALTSARRPFLHRYEVDGEPYAQIHDFDRWCNRTFRRNRKAPEIPEPPEDVWTAAHCSPIYSGNREGAPEPNKPGFYGVTRFPESSGNSGTAGDNRKLRRAPAEPEPELELELEPEGGAGGTAPLSQAEPATTTTGRKRTKKAKPAPPAAPAWEDLPTGLRVWLQRWCDEMSAASVAMATDYSRDEMLERMWPKLAKVRKQYGDEVMCFGIAQQIDADKGWGTGSKSDGIRYLKGCCRNATADEVQAWKARMRGGGRRERPRLRPVEQELPDLKPAFDPRTLDAEAAS